MHPQIGRLQALTLVGLLGLALSMVEAGTPSLKSTRPTVERDINAVSATRTNRPRRHISQATQVIQPLAQAEPRRRAFDIPPQDLGPALKAFADAAGLRLVVPPEMVAGRRTPGLSGPYTPTDIGLHYSLLKNPYGPLNHVEVGFFVENLFDEEYVLSSFNIARTFPGAPRTFVGRLKIQF